MDSEYESLPASNITTLPVTKREGGPGRPPGKKNYKTIAREKKLLLEIEKQAAAMSNIDLTDPLAVLEHCMASRFRAGDLAGAAAVAKELAPYRASKLATTAPRRCRCPRI